MNALECSLVSMLIDGVVAAIPEGGSERDVRTIITIGMWKKWCHALGMELESMPTEWKAIDCNRIYGSETMLVAAPGYWAVSTAKR